MRAPLRGARTSARLAPLADKLLASLAQFTHSIALWQNHTCRKAPSANCSRCSLIFATGHSLETGHRVATGHNRSTGHNLITCHYLGAGHFLISGHSWQLVTPGNWSHILATELDHHQSPREGFGSISLTVWEP